MPFKVIQGHRCPYQSKDRMRLVINSNWHPISYRFEVIADCCWIPYNLSLTVFTQRTL